MRDIMHAERVAGQGAKLLPDRPDLDMASRLAQAVARFIGEQEEAGVAYAYTLYDVQASVFDSVAEFIRGCLSEIEVPQPYGRIILPPRTGKTVIAGKTIARTGLTTTYITNTKTLVEQAVRDFREQMPDTLVGMFYGDRQEVVPFGVNVTTYEMMRSRWQAGRLPDAIRTSGLVFLDEAHHVMTKHRLAYLAQAFDPRALRVALTATPDFDAHRALGRFFPELIHELTLLEAVELNLLAPLRVWVAEVDADASEVQIVNGEYHEATLARIMSGAPFFEAARAFRYAEENRRDQALITCETRQQAYDCQRYFETHRPTQAPSTALVLGETPNRERILEYYEKGVIDTIISVKALVEGWDAPRCKVLLDLAPCLSLVMATQKFCRVLTRWDDREARIYMILPKNLKRSPIMPMELLSPGLEEYEAGELVAPKTATQAAHVPKLQRHPRKHPVEGVELKSRIVLIHRVEKPLLNPLDRHQVRRVLSSHAWFSTERACTFTRFRRIVFRHELFTGRADHLMRYLGYRPNAAGYERLLERYCPEAAATLLLEGHAALDERTCQEDLRFLQLATLAGTHQNEAEREKFEYAHYALGQPGEFAACLPDEILVWRKRWEQTEAQLRTCLTTREIFLLLSHFGVAGVERSMTEVAGMLALSKAGVQQRILRLLQKLRIQLHPALARQVEVQRSMRKGKALNKYDVDDAVEWARRNKQPEPNATLILVESLSS